MMTKRLYALTFLTLVYFFPIYAQTSNYEKYEANKKSEVATLALQLFFPGAGNAYANQSTLKVIAYPTLYVGCLAAAIVGGNAAHYREQRGAWYVGGIIGASLVNLIGTIDAVIGCENYNANLRKKYDLVIKGNSLQLVYNF
jgi:hypothetical protein